MWSNDAALGHRGGPRLLGAAVAGLAALIGGALFLGLFDGGLPPKPARAEAAPAFTAGGGPARPSVPGLCFGGPGGEFLDFTPAGQHRP